MIRKLRLDSFLFREINDNHIIYTFNPFQINNYNQINSIQQLLINQHRGKRLISNEIFQNKVRSITDIIVNNFFTDSKQINQSDFELIILNPELYQDTLLKMNIEIDKYLGELKHHYQFQTYTLFAKKFNESKEVTSRN